MAKKRIKLHKGLICANIGPMAIIYRNDGERESGI